MGGHRARSPPQQRHTELPTLTDEQHRCPPAPEAVSPTGLLPGLFLVAFWDTEARDGSRRIFSRCCSSSTARWRSSCSLRSASSSLLLLSSTLVIRHKLHTLQAGAPSPSAWIPQWWTHYGDGSSTLVFKFTALTPERAFQTHEVPSKACDANLAGVPPLCSQPLSSEQPSLWHFCCCL